MSRKNIYIEEKQYQLGDLLREMVEKRIDCLIEKITNFPEGTELSDGTVWVRKDHVGVYSYKTL